ncbi:vegetative incompatibility protein het-e-1 [Colletotrichum musicola]|uniref:Vegetative incompatibility protein het-e-1 n=1 Tax=Colletotrichum musicola TaxID=2175873 RepID=A0A8H6MJ39_9PEZI|nr:vegetative incompatibility protein het-e-1 [Colletotrichum musicola]
MGLSEFRRRLKGTLRRGGSHADQLRTQGNPSAPVQIPHEQVSSSVADVSQSSPSINRAYKALRDENAQLVAQYEELLSKELEDHVRPQNTPQQDEDPDRAENRIEANSTEEANHNGLSYVTYRIQYYVELERLLWPANMYNPGLKVEFKSHIIDLYQYILEFQLKTVLQFYQR